MRRAITLLLLLGVMAPVASASRSAHVRKVYDARLAAVQPRQGIQHRSLVLVALVLRQPEKPLGLLVDPAPLAWAPGSAKRHDSHAVLTWHEVEGAPERSPVVLPSGTVLTAGMHERLLQRPALLEPGAPFTARSVTLVPADEASEAPTPSGTIGGAAPPEYGHTMFLLRKAEALHDLLDLEAAALGVDPKATKSSLASLAARDEVKTRVDACAGAVRPLSRAFGGDTVGHVAFLGDGVVQVVLAGAPDTYASTMQHAASGLGLALTAWEALYGVDDDPPAPARWDDYVSATARLLEHLRSASFKPMGRKDETGAGGELWRVRATKAMRSGRPPDVGWLLLHGDGAPVLFEAWPDNAPLPPPTATPGVLDPDPADDDARMGGALTWYFAKRFYDRFPWRRAPQWVRRAGRTPLPDGRRER